MINDPRKIDAIRRFHNNWSSTSGSREFLKKFVERVKKYGLYKAAAMSAVGASNQRALKVGKGHYDDLEAAKNECYDIIEKALIRLFSHTGTIAKTFDNISEWEEDLARTIRDIHHRHGITDYTLGNAQKWISLAIKYILWYEGENFDEDVLDNGFFPIDSIIQKKAKEEFGVPPMGSWGKCDDWETIKKYEKDVRDKIKESGEYCGSPIIWEISNWIF